MTIEPDPTAPVLDILRLEEDPGTPDQFTGRSLPQPSGRVFGGQVLAQALLAAGRTVTDGRLPHSLHGYFLRAGDVREPITFAVERLRDGRSFTARRTHALQGGEAILSMITSFQEEQPGLDYADPMPAGIPGPEEVPSALDVLGGIDHPVAKFWTQEAAFDVRHVDGSIYLGPPAEATGQQAVWFRSRGPLPDDQLLHRALLAYACDQVMLEPILRRAGRSWVTRGLSIASPGPRHVVAPGRPRRRLAAVRAVDAERAGRPRARAPHGCSRRTARSSRRSPRRAWSASRTDRSPRGPGAAG